MELRWVVKTYSELPEFDHSDTIRSEPVLQQKGMLDNGTRFVAEWEDVPTVVIEE